MALEMRRRPVSGTRAPVSLRAEGVVATRREGQTISYRMSTPATLRMIDALCDIFQRRRC